MYALPILPTLHVLVIEDDPDMRRLLARTLTRNGVASVIEASSGEEGLKLLEDPSQAINFVLSDWNLPGISGIELCRRLKATRPVTPVLMITGRADVRSIEIAREAGIDGYLIKPTSPRQLVEKIRFVMQQTRCASRDYPLIKLTRRWPEAG